MYRPDDKVLQAGTVKEAIDNMQNNNIDMAFIDLNLNEENGMDFLKWLKKERQEVKTIFITSSSREQDFLQAKDMGVDAYILKDAFIDEIMFGLKAVERGSKFYSAELVENIGSSTEEDKKLSSLTARETEVLKLLH